jgi:protein phosphatase
VTLSIPDLALVVLVGPSGSGKSSFARRHFLASEILSSDYCRFLVSDDENDQAATNDAYEVLHFIASKRLAAGKMVVVDATNVQPFARKNLVELARKYQVPAVAIVLNLPESVCLERNRTRSDRNLGFEVVRNQSEELRRSLDRLACEGFWQVHILANPSDVDPIVIERQPLGSNRESEHELKSPPLLSLPEE